MADNAPICLFTYNRLDEVKRTILALQKNYLSSQSDLFIFSDYANSEREKLHVSHVREYLKTVRGFKSVTVFESDKNKGLARSIIDGVTLILKNSDKVIVIEDDLVSSPNFLDFMNQALEYYKDEQRIFSVTGWSLPLNSLKKLKGDYYLHNRMSSWGWGIWRNRWEKINWDNTYYESFVRSSKKQKLFKKGGADLPGMLKNHLKGKINSWAIRACYHQFENNLLVLAPKKSKINNIGFANNATHTKRANRFDQPIDESLQRTFLFTDELQVVPEIVSECSDTYSLFRRVKARIMYLF